MREISDWVNMIFFAIVFLVVFNMISQPKIENQPKTRQPIQDPCVDYEKSMIIKELEKEIDNYKERLDDYKSQVEVWKLIMEKKSEIEQE